MIPRHVHLSTVLLACGALSGLGGDLAAQELRYGAPIPAWTSATPGATSP